MEPSSATKGFFQAQPSVLPLTEDDAVLQRLLSLHLPSPLPPSVAQDLNHFSRLVLSKKVLDHVADAEKNQPYLKPLSTFGVENKQDPLVTSEGWRSLQDIGIKEGIVALAYGDKKFDGVELNARVYRSFKVWLWTPSAAMVTCPSGMTDGAASLLVRHLHGENGEIFTEARKRLVSRDPAYSWTSGQWMTERKGGSDVRGTETRARLLTPEELVADKGVDAIGMPLGPWRLDGFKWFSSATDANMSILLAKTGNDDSISCFFAPVRRRVEGSSDGETELNGIRIQRLKNKFGTKTLPTAELEIKGMRGYLLGSLGNGVKEISTILSYTRVNNALSAMSFWARALSVCRAYSKVRTSGGKLLKDIPAYVRTLANDTVKYSANMHLTYFVVSLLGISEGNSSANTAAAQAKIIPSDRDQCLALLRILTPMIKARTALRAIKGVRSAMENLGGIGYLENEDVVLNIGRLFRDCCVLSIWEGTTEIQADDLMRVAKGKQGPECLGALEKWVMNALSIAKNASFDAEAKVVQRIWDEWLAEIKSLDKEQLKWQGRDCLKAFEDVMCGCLLMLDAARDGDPVAREITRRWVLKDQLPQRSWTEESDWDRRIVYGTETLAARL
ncbi:hypothetical protein FQN57_004502 [Myotisia sp. PD_48]|nr:hypothetical protein FQN57_004502 [Myotisia sp. PD_48]